MLTIIVGIPWRKPVTPCKSHFRSTNLAHAVLRLDYLHGGDLLPVLL
jgi:hypothetical protein